MAATNPNDITSRRILNTEEVPQYGVIRTIGNGFKAIGAWADQAATTAVAMTNVTRELMPEVENFGHNFVDGAHVINKAVRVGIATLNESLDETIQESGWEASEIENFSIPAYAIKRKVTAKKEEVKESSSK